MNINKKELYIKQIKFSNIMLNKKIRKKVYDKTYGHCFYCGKVIEDGPRKFHVDHFVPLESGGKNILSNFVPSCQSCNLRKGRKEVTEWRVSIKNSIKKTKSLLLLLENILENDSFWFERHSK